MTKIIKVRKSYRFDPDVVEMMQTLLTFVSQEKNIKLTETALLEMLVSERYDKLARELGLDGYG